jgi:hypothetical protein
MTVVGDRNLKSEVVDCCCTCLYCLGWTREGGEELKDRRRRIKDRGCSVVCCCVVGVGRTSHPRTFFSGLT